MCGLGRPVLRLFIHCGRILVGFAGHRIRVGVSCRCRRPITANPGAILHGDRPDRESHQHVCIHLGLSGQVGCQPSRTLSATAARTAKRSVLGRISTASSTWRHSTDGSSFPPTNPVSSPLRIER
jgi:hypothetical protein